MELITCKNLHFGKILSKPVSCVMLFQFFVFFMWPYNTGSQAVLNTQESESLSDTRCRNWWIFLFNKGNSFHFRINLRKICRDMYQIDFEFLLLLKIWFNLYLDQHLYQFFPINFGQSFRFPNVKLFIFARKCTKRALWNVFSLLIGLFSSYIRSSWTSEFCAQTRACWSAAWPSPMRVCTTAMPLNTASFSPCCASAFRSFPLRSWLTSYLDFPGQQEEARVTHPSTGCGTGTSCLSSTIRSWTAWRSFATEFGKRSENKRGWRLPTATTRANPTAPAGRERWPPLLRSSKAVRLLASSGHRLELKQLEARHASRTLKKVKKTQVCWTAKPWRTIRKRKTFQRVRASWRALRLQEDRGWTASTQPSGDGCRTIRRDATGGPMSSKGPREAFEEKAHRQMDICSQKHMQAQCHASTQAHQQVW